MSKMLSLFGILALVASTSSQFYGGGAVGSASAFGGRGGSFANGMASSPFYPRGYMGGYPNSLPYGYPSPYQNFGSLPYLPGQVSPFVSGMQAIENENANTNVNINGGPSFRRSLHSPKPGATSAPTPTQIS